MAMASALIGAFDHELTLTRKVLERIPDDQVDWRPHDKSFALGRLADHVVQLIGHAVTVLQTEEFDIAGAAPGATGQASAQARLDLFDRQVTALRDNLARTADADLAAPWTLRNREQVIFTLPRGGTLRSMILHHLIHHRGQLTVYFRLLDIPVPALYGPSADEAS